MSSLQLQSWIHAVIAENRAKDEAFRRFAAEYGGRPGPRRPIEAYRDFNLQRTLRYAYEKSGFYKEQFLACGLTPEDIPGFEQLSRFPLTDPRDLSLHPNHFLCTSQSEVARPCTFVTSGTSGPRKKIFWSRWDIERITDFMAAGIATVAEPDDTVQILLPSGGPDSQADLLRQGVEKLGSRALVTGMDATAREQIEKLEEFHSTIVFGYAGYVFRISKELQPRYDLRSKGVRVLFLAGEYLPAARRHELESIWGCSVRTHYGLTEMGLGVAVECDGADGYHFNEADLLLEIVHPETGERLPPGEEGELVFTTLTREAMPLIRYRTRDLTRLLEEPCRCGAAGLQKFDVVRKRLDGIVTLANGAEICPAVFDDLLYRFRDIIDYRVKLLGGNNKERLEFTIETARKNEDTLREIRSAILGAPILEKSLASGAMEAPVVEFAAMGHPASTNREKKRVLDCRSHGDQR
jgi:phenylacetate-CoA ligase